MTNLHLQHLYKGFSSTHLLWNKIPVMGLNQFQLDGKYIALFNRAVHKKLRLGQLAEQFVFNQLEDINNCNILVENLQVQNGKHTLGELDTLIEINKKKIHLEIVYKFYLFDDSLGDSEIERWIGPNRNDSLIEKITKLKNKQLPLLYSQECKSALEALNLDIEDFQQQVLFKAQLFCPYKTEIEFDILNKNCLEGFYLNNNQLEDFKTCEFYIPSKLDWFLEAHNAVKWINFETMKAETSSFLKLKKLYYQSVF